MLEHVCTVSNAIPTAVIKQIVKVHGHLIAFSSDYSVLDHIKVKTL